MRRLFATGIAAVLVVGAISLLAALPTRAEVSASSTNPCSLLPKVCRYKWNPVERCCVADPRFDCFDVCY